MDQFITNHADKLQGTLSCFDRVLFRGYLPFYSGYAMASFLDSRGIRRREVKRFVLTQAYRLKDHARQMAAREGRPYQYFGERTRKEDLARQVAERDGIAEGLVCVFAVVEPCRTFSLRWREGAAFIQSARRKSLSLYDSFLDRDLGLIHVRLQTWFPIQLQVYVNGHESLVRKLTRHGIRYTKQDNGGDRVSGEPSLNKSILMPDPRAVCRDEVLQPLLHHAQASARRADGHGLQPRGQHRMKLNWIKMYDKAGVVLRIETVINQPEEFRVRRRVPRRGRRRTEWVPLRKSVAYLFRYRELSLQSNARYLNALAQVDDPTPGLRNLKTLTTPKTPASGRRVKAFNPVARPDGQLFGALLNGEHALHGFTNRDLREKLAATKVRLHPDPTKRSAQRSAVCSIASTSLGWLQRFRAPAAGASPPLAIVS